MDYQTLQQLAFVEGIFTILAEIAVTSLAGVIIVLLIREAKNHETN